MSRIIQATAAAFALAATLGASNAQAVEKLVVVRDAETGQLRAPNAAEIDAMKKAEGKQRATSRAVPPVGGVETRYADGTIGRTLGEDDMMSSVAVRNADGSITTDCLPAKQAEQIARNPKATSLKKSTPLHKDHAGYERF